MSFKCLAQHTKLGTTTVSSIAYECCTAIVQEFSAELLPVPTSETWSRKILELSFEVEAAISLQGDVGGLRRKGKNERFWIIPFVTAEEIPRTRCQELPTTGAARTPWHRQLPHFMRWRICSDPSHAEAVHPNRMGESNARLWFNGRFNSARRVVENTFGIITSRLRVFHRSLHGFLDIVNSS